MPQTGLRDQIARCGERACRHAALDRCAYRDQRGVGCPSFWCREHGTGFAGGRYCRRHAAMLQMLGTVEQFALPEASNRAPSLCGWISRELDHSIRDVLLCQAPISGANLAVSPVYLVPTRLRQERRWQRSWKLLDNVSVLGKVILEVNEREPTEILARVGGELVGHGIPSWIQRRQSGRVIDAATEAEERIQFCAGVHRAIELAVGKQALAVNSF